MKSIKRFWILIGILLLFNVVIYLTKWGGETIFLWISDLLPVVCSLISAICLFIAVKEFKQTDFAKIAWTMILSGIVLSFLAETIYAFLELIVKMDVNVIFPTVADYFWCTGYIPMFIGLGMIFYGYKKTGLLQGYFKVYIFVSLIFMVILAAASYFLLIPIIKDTETDSFSKFFYLFYPIGDLIVIAPAITLIYITSMFGNVIISKPWRYLALGFTCFTIADLIYSYLSWLELYGPGNFVDLIWNLGYLLIGLSGLYQKQLIETINGGKQ